MDIWCPQCGGNEFFYTKLGESGHTLDTIVKDHMKCKNRKCSYEFNIEWFNYIREEWMQESNESRIRAFQRHNRT